MWSSPSGGTGSPFIVITLPPHRWRWPAWRSPHRGQAIVSESVLAYSRQAGPGLLNPMEAAAAAGSLWGRRCVEGGGVASASFTRRISSRPWRCPGGARPALASSRSAHTRVAGEVASQLAMMAEFMPRWPRVATAGAGFLAARARASANPSATSTGAVVCSRSGHPRTTTASLNCSVGPFIESAVHGGAAVPGDEDQVDATQLWQVGPCLGPCSRLCGHGDDGSGSRVIMVKVFGADPAHWPGERQLWAPQIAVGEPLPGGMFRGLGDGD